MQYIVSTDKDGKIIYNGMLSSKEKEIIDNMIDKLTVEVPKVEAELKEKYGDSILYKYYLGVFLSELLTEYNISFADRFDFWEEIKTLFTVDNKNRDKNSVSKTRSFYERCFEISQYDVKAIKKLTWRQWCRFLEGQKIKRDERIITWIANTDEKIREDDWREFQKGLNIFLKNKNTSVFSDDELFKTYDSIMAMCKFWRKSFKNFSKKFPEDQRIKKETYYAKEYKIKCFEIKRQTRESLDQNIFSKAFAIVMEQ